MFHAAGLILFAFTLLGLADGPAIPSTPLDPLETQLPSRDPRRAVHRSRANPVKPAAAPSSSINQRSRAPAATSRRYPARSRPSAPTSLTWGSRFPTSS